MTKNRYTEFCVPDRASYWLDKAATALDCAIQCCAVSDNSKEIDEMEERCTELAKQLKERGN